MGIKEQIKDMKQDLLISSFTVDKSVINGALGTPFLPLWHAGDSKNQAKIHVWTSCRRTAFPRDTPYWLSEE